MRKQLWLVTTHFWQNQPSDTAHSVGDGQVLYVTHGFVTGTGKKLFWYGTESAPFPRHQNPLTFSARMWHSKSWVPRCWLGWIKFTTQHRYYFATVQGDSSFQLTVELSHSKVDSQKRREERWVFVQDRKRTGHSYNFFFHIATILSMTIRIFVVVTMQMRQRLLFAVASSVFPWIFWRCCGFDPFMWRNLIVLTVALTAVDNSISSMPQIYTLVINASFLQLKAAMIEACVVCKSVKCNWGTLSDWETACCK